MRAATYDPDGRSRFPSNLNPARTATGITDGGTDAFGIQGSAIAQRQQAWSYRWIQDGSVSYDRRRALQANKNIALTTNQNPKRELMSYASDRVGLSLYYTSTTDNVLTEASLREIAADLSR